MDIPLQICGIPLAVFIKKELHFLGIWISYVSARQPIKTMFKSSKTCKSSVSDLFLIVLQHLGFWIYKKKIDLQP